MKTSRMFKNAVCLVAAFSLAACARSKSEDLVPPAPLLQQAQVTGAGITFDLNPKVDILFVVDNSESMGKSAKDPYSEIEELQKASEYFVNAFGENSLIDYHFGVITVYDSRRCGKPDVKTGEILNCYPEGVLQPVRQPTDKLEAMPAEPMLIPVPGFVSRSEGAKDVIRSTLNVGVLPYNKGGPRFEELYSPILKAVSPQGNQVNGGFIRPDSKVVIVMVTDEDDSSATISEDDFLFGLDQLVGIKRVELHAVLALDGCKRNSYADAPDRIKSVVERMNGRAYKICDPANFGKNLGSIGEDIRKKMMTKDIQLATVPERGTLKLYYGDQQIPEGQGWSYNPRTNRIHISDDIKVKYTEGAKFSASFVKYEGKQRVMR